MDNDAVVVSAVRTAIGKYAGALASVRAFELGAAVIREAVDRSGIDPRQIDDVYFGNLLGLPGNVAKVAAMKAGLPETVTGVTIDRQCASGLESLTVATAMIQSGAGEVYVCGGAESMTNQPHYLEKSSKPYSMMPPRFLSAELNPPEMGVISMGETAENVLDHYDISRRELDEFALRSHTRAVDAIKHGVFESQIVPVEVKRKKTAVQFDKDESPREDTSLEIMSKLPPLFRQGGKVTAANSCPLSDGASALVVMSRAKARRLGLKPLGVLRGFAHVGVDFRLMGLGPVHAVKKLLEKTAVSLGDVGLIELNEAFSSQSLACIRELGLDLDSVNVNGGAIALGHPLGATGAILVTKILYEMDRKDVRYGLVTMCVGGGQGSALLLERF